MESDSRDTLPELIPQNIIRVETALSRFPIHRLGTKSTSRIQIREDGLSGEVKVRWSVKHQPGPLAYKLDTLIVNRKIEEAARPVPRLIKLGSLRQICRDLGISEGKGTQNVKEAIYQNAQAFITAKTRYRTREGLEQTLEAGFTRYSVIFTGEEMPDGRRADAVYIVLNDLYMQVINGAMTRPLDYDYLRELPPASQRFYEILSYQIFATLKYGRDKARLIYSEFCTYAPQARHLDYDRVKKQMFKVHAPHRRSGYIKAVEFHQSTDAEGRPDWEIHYTPGLKARAEYRAFTKKGGPKFLELAIEPILPPQEPRELTELERELIARGVTEKTARELVAEHPEERIQRQMEQTDWLREAGKKKIADLAAYLVKSVRDDFAPPRGFEPKAERDARTEAALEKERLEAEAKRRQREQERREQVIQKQVSAYWLALSTDEQRELDAAALKEADPEAAETYRGFEAKKSPFAETLFRTSIRDPYIRRHLNSEAELDHGPLKGPPGLVGQRFRPEPSLCLGQTRSSLLEP